MYQLGKLTPQEHRVLTLVAKGWSNTKIARELFISPRTVETHLYRVFDKLDVSSRTEAALYILTRDRDPHSQVSRYSDDALVEHTYSREVR